MTLKISDKPGSHERHLLRREHNPLFKSAQSDVNHATLMEAQRNDHDIYRDYHRRFQTVLKQCVNLSPNEEADYILQLKGELVHVYTLATAVADDQTSIKDALIDLIGSITNTLKRYADEGNEQSQQMLVESEQATQMHLHLLQSQLVADLLMNPPVIPTEQLTPTLLSTPREELALVLQLFTPEQVHYSVNEGNQLLTELDHEGHDVSLFAKRLLFIEGYLAHLEATAGANANTHSTNTNDGVA